MRRAPAFLALGLLAAALGSVGTTALADPLVYEYRIVHPTYGDIGTYANIVSRSGGQTRVETKLHIAVRAFGATLFEEEAARREYWQGDRLISFEGVTDTNGKRLEVRGEARDGGFAITTPTGTTIAPPNVHPSNPWSAEVLDTDMMMSTKTGKLSKVRVIPEGRTQAAPGITGRDLRRYEIDGDKRQYVWLDDRGVPVAFRTEEEHAPIDFIMIQPGSEKVPAKDGSTEKAAAPRIPDQAGWFRN
jgi:hypothetical protein